MRRYDRTSGARRYELFDTWLELRTSRCFQMHRFTDAACEILEHGDYGLRRMNTTCVKAIQVTPVTYVGDREVPGDPECISIKFPSTPRIRGPGLLVYETGSEHAEGGEVITSYRPPDLFDRVVEVEPAPLGLVMDERHRVMSITPYRVRLFGTGRIEDTLGEGRKDAANPPMAPLTPEIIAALETLTF